MNIQFESVHAARVEYVEWEGGVLGAERDERGVL